MSDHVPIEDLAAYAAGDLDAAAAVPVEAHVVLCADCRADVEALRSVTASLNAAGSPPMPADVAARLDAALAAEAVPAQRAPAGDVLPMAPRRKRPTWAGVAAVAAGVALVGGIAVPLLSGTGTRNDATTAAEGARDAASSAPTRRLSSGLAYSRDTLTATLATALSGKAEVASSHDPGAPPVAAPSPLSGADSGTASRGPGLSGGSTFALQTDAGRLAACISELVGATPVAGRTPLVMDFGTFERRPAMVLVFPSVMTDGRLRANRVDVFVVGAGCGVEKGGDVLDFQRIPRPPI
jgi:hypothetical protein